MNLLAHIMGCFCDSWSFRLVFRWFSQLDGWRLERLLGYLRRRIPDAQRAVRLPRRRRPSGGGGRPLCGLHRGPALSADLQHAEMRRVPCNQLERGEYPRYDSKT